MRGAMRCDSMCVYRHGPRSADLVAPQPGCLVVCMPVSGWKGLGRIHAVSAHETGNACRGCAPEGVIRKEWNGALAEPYV